MFVLPNATTNLIEICERALQSDPSPATILWLARRSDRTEARYTFASPCDAGRLCDVIIFDGPAIVGKTF